MSVFNADDDILSNDEPVKSVEMEDISATEMETAPCSDQDIGCTSTKGEIPPESGVPIEGGHPLDGAGSPIEMDRNSPTEKMVEAQDEPNDTEMETSNEMEVCPQEKEGESEQKESNFDELIVESSTPTNEPVVVTDQKEAKFEELIADSSTPIDEPVVVTNGPSTGENENVPALEAGDNSMDTDKQPADDEKAAPEILMKDFIKEPVSNQSEAELPLKQDEELVNQNEIESAVKSNEDESTTNDCEIESAAHKSEDESIANPNEESNQMGVSDDVQCVDEKEETESTGRASATCFATFDDESRLSNDKISVDNVEDVNINESTDVEVEGEEAANEQEGEDPLEAGGVVDDSKNDDVEEEILGHIPVSGESIERANKSLEENNTDLQNSEVEKMEEDVSIVEKKNDEPKEPEELEHEELAEPETRHCHQCNTEKECLFILKTSTECSKKFYLCTKECCNEYKNRPKIKAIASNKLQTINTEEPEKAPDLTRRCFSCRKEIDPTNSEKLSWQSMEYCSEECIESYQNELGACCANCKGDVPQASMGKYCVRFGYNARQFCSSKCLEEFKKGLKVCSYCQRDISGENEGFLAPIGDKGQFKDFCSKNCMDDYHVILCNRPKPVITDSCAVCSDMKEITIEVIQSGGVQRLCSDPCFAAFKFANNLKTDECELCKRHFDAYMPGRQRVYYNDVMHNFCSRKCHNVHTLSSRRIISCGWCKVKKYNFDMIEMKFPCSAPLCSLKCLQLFKVSQTASNSQVIKCDMCKKQSQGSCHLTMSDSTIRNFCCFVCCMDYQKMSNMTPVMDPRAVSTMNESEPTVPIISNVTSLAVPTSRASPVELTAPAISTTSTGVSTGLSTVSSTPAQHIKIVQQTFVRPPPCKSVSNKSTFCKPATMSKGVMNKPVMAAKACQTDFEENKTPALIPVPVPIYVPVPLAMYSFPTPIPVPFPVPIPVPMFIPTTRNSAKGIFKEIKRIADQVPRDPFEAELLMMAEMVADDKKGNVTSDSDDDDRGNADIGAPSPMNDSDDAVEPPTPAPTNDPPVTPSFGGEDILQMAVNMAMEMTEPAPPQPPSLDLETVLTPQPVVPIQPPPLSTLSEERSEPVQRGRKRGRGRGSSNNNWTSAKRTRASSRELSHHQEIIPHDTTHHDRSLVDSDNEPTIEPDPDLQLKFSYGVLAFRKWIKEKNSELSLSGKAAKLFKTDILQLSTEELNFTLCMFVKEVRKPDGDEYAPDIIFYLCLGIQLYLYRNGRVDNIFTDAFYEKFTDCLNQVSSKFVTRLNDRSTFSELPHDLLTRVEEEHLWESQQLGAHSPHVLLFTLMYFNTKYFYLTEVEDHMRLSFTHVMKHWKRNNTQPGKSGPSRNVLLRYYPPQSVLDADERKKKVYEQQENELNPLRCPVKLYEFYVSKCPESVRGRNDVFYLLPERSCVPDSPVWYSTMSMPKEAVSRMLNRIRMVREILCILHSLEYH
ncbi:Hypothetical predicted protein [Cloeon dipterum]|uniref:TRASH domain-containing protein n=1 Tax=Cloeon dipterum TaxID=197152 RepID=A0A8S1C3S1_9INSE|nr:Hypothetical predicted protein [Cloeon dipterum]